jgi:diaminohydroxyphosphoribosylaminopyrimidine deaminase/5-amino-6-(5-phosphoribosylamino)uracil reductase
VKSTSEKRNKDHEFFMKRCLELAEKGRGFVSPNPLVGCVIVKNGKIAGEGYHKEFGSHHAEVNAINAALGKKVNLKGSTMYVNLEPCVHTGKTPPCVAKIIDTKIREVIIGIIDPNPLVAGKGIKKLKKHRIKVTEGVLEDKCNELNKFYLKHIKTGLPYITIKAAQTLDGKIADAGGNSKWISSLESRKFVHKLRSEYDAVLVGSKTVSIDNPSLTVRHVKGRNPYRIVINKDLVLNLQNNLFSDDHTEKTVIITAKEPDEFLSGVFEQRKIKVVTAKLKNEKIDLYDAMKKIAKLGIASVLVEGGAYTLTEFIDQKLADEILIFISPKTMGTGLNLIRQGSQFDFTKTGEITCSMVEKDILITIKLK